MVKAFPRSIHGPPTTLCAIGAVVSAFSTHLAQQTLKFKEAVRLHALGLLSLMPTLSPPLSHLNTSSLSCNLGDCGESPQIDNSSSVAASRARVRTALVRLPTAAPLPDYAALIRHFLRSVGKLCGFPRGDVNHLCTKAMRFTAFNTRYKNRDWHEGLSYSRLELAFDVVMYLRLLCT